MAISIKAPGVTAPSPQVQIDPGSSRMTAVPNAAASPSRVGPSVADVTDHPQEGRTPSK